MTAECTNAEGVILKVYKHMGNILITGASGFIGSHIAERCVVEGHNVYAVLRESSSKEYLNIPGINFIYIKLNNRAEIVNKLRVIKSNIGKFDYVIHNAGITQAKNASDFDNVNFLYTRNIVEALYESGNIPDKFIFMSSLAACGPGDELSMKPITDNSEQCPITNYGASKLKAEKYLREQNKLDYVIIRPTGVYGPRDKDYFQYIKTILKNIEVYIGGKNQLLSFIHVYDLANIVTRIFNSNVVNTTLFATDGGTYTSKEFAGIVKSVTNKRTIKVVIPKWLFRAITYMAETISGLFGKTALLNSDKYKDLTSKNWSCNADTTFRLLEYKPEYTLHKGIQNTYEWYKTHRWIN